MIGLKVHACLTTFNTMTADERDYAYRHMSMMQTGVDLRHLRTDDEKFVYYVLFSNSYNYTTYQEALSRWRAVSDTVTCMLFDSTCMRLAISTASVIEQGFFWNDGLEVRSRAKEALMKTFIYVNDCYRCTVILNGLPLAQQLLHENSSSPAVSSSTSSSSP
jgi:hypothetical protein